MKYYRVIFCWGPFFIFYELNSSWCLLKLKVTSSVLNLCHFMSCRVKARCVTCCVMSYFFIFLFFSCCVVSCLKLIEGRHVVPIVSCLIVSCIIVSCLYNIMWLNCNKRVFIIYNYILHSCTYMDVSISQMNILPPNASSFLTSIHLG
jgi:hypothetical protein